MEMVPEIAPHFSSVVSSPHHHHHIANLTTQLTTGSKGKSMGVTHSLEICTLSQRTLYRNLTFSSTKVFHRICSRLEVTAHQQTRMWPRWRRHISISTAPFKDTSASCSYLTPSILSTAVTLTTHSAQRFSAAREGTGRCWGTKRPERALLRVKSGVTYGDSYGRVATQRKPAHLRRQLGTLQRRLARISSEEARPSEADGRWYQSALPHGGFGDRSLRVYSLVKGLSGVLTRNPCCSASWSLVQCWSLLWRTQATNNKPRSSPHLPGSSSSHIRLLFQLLVLSNRLDLLRAILNFYITEAQEQTWLHLQ